MAADISMKFDYGDAVELVDEESRRRFGIERGSVCGFRVLDVIQAAEMGMEEGTRLVLVEAQDGDAVEVPIQFLRCIDCT